MGSWHEGHDLSGHVAERKTFSRWQFSNEEFNHLVHCLARGKKLVPPGVTLTMVLCLDGMKDCKMLCLLAERSFHWKQVLRASRDGVEPPGFVSAAGSDSVQSAEDSRLINTVCNLRAQQGHIFH